MNSVLIDTSVWRRYFTGKLERSAAARLDTLLDEDGAICVHSAVIGELVLGGLSRREEELFQRLPKAPEIESSEVMTLIRDRKLMRRGVGWVDCQLLASALVLPAKLWSLDKSLAETAEELAVGF